MKLLDTIIDAFARAAVFEAGGFYGTDGFAYTVLDAEKGIDKS